MAVDADSCYNDETMPPVADLIRTRGRFIYAVDDRLRPDGCNQLPMTIAKLGAH